MTAACGSGGKLIRERELVMVARRLDRNKSQLRSTRGGWIMESQYAV